jgi:hypothetical protein
MAIRENYLFSGCNSMGVCNTIIKDPISKNILDSIPSKGQCGAWDLGDYTWDNNVKQWIIKKSQTPSPAPSPSLVQSPERATTPKSMPVIEDKIGYGLKESKEKQKLIKELLSKKNENIKNISHIINELKGKHKQRIEVLSPGASKTMDMRNNRIRITVDDSGIILNVRRG